MNEINLYVDDLRRAPENFMIARTYEEAIDILNRHQVNILSLDHDLGIDDNGIEKTGYDIAKYICEHEISPKKIYIHSDNVVGRENIYQVFLSARKHGFINKNTEIYNYKYT